MKKNLFKSSMIVAGLMAMASCSEEQMVMDSVTTDSGESTPVTITAEMPQNSDTRLQLTDNTTEIEVTWKASGETFSVFKDSDGAPGTFTQASVGNDAHTATFTGKLYVDETATYYAAYPAVAASVGTQNMPLDMTGQMGTLDENKVYMYAGSTITDNSLNFAFKHLTSILKITPSLPTDFTVTGTTTPVSTRAESITKVTLSGKGLVAKATADITTGEISNVEEVESVTLTGSFDGDIYLHVIPCTLTNLKLMVESADGKTYMATLTDKLEVEAGVVYATSAEMEEEKTITLSNVGELNIDDIRSYNTIKLIGDINGTDIQTIREWASVERNMLDLSEVHIVTGEERYYTTIGSTSGYTTTENVISEMMFENRKFKAINLPKDTKSLEFESLWCCQNITNLEIPDGVETLGSYSLGNCVNLVSITIPESVTTIESSAFYFCMKLESVTIPEKVTKIENSTFSWCYALSSITFLGDITNIDYEAFKYCTSLADIYYRGTTLPTLGTDIFKESTSKCTLHVNTEDIKSAFMEDESWKALVDDGTLEIVVGD